MGILEEAMAGDKEKATVESLPFSHPLFLHPSDTQGAALISHILTGTENYTVWSRAMRIALLGKQKLGFIDGTCLKSNQDEGLKEQWELCNAIVLSWILNSLSKELANGVIYFQNAHHVWVDLKERFNKCTGSRVFALHRELSSLRQGSSSVSTYFSKLKELWEEQSALTLNPCCTCEASKFYAQRAQE